MSGLIKGYSWVSSRYWSHIYHHGAPTTPDIYVVTIYMLLTLSAHAREGYSSHFVCLFLDCGEGAVFRVETYISTF